MEELEETLNDSNFRDDDKSSTVDVARIPPEIHYLTDDDVIARWKLLHAQNGNEDFHIIKLISTRSKIKIKDLMLK